jgi:hypothetical protein
MGLEPLLLTYGVGPGALFYRVDGAAIFILTVDVHCCCFIFCASLDKGYTHQLVPYGDQSAPPGQRGPSHEVEEVEG